MKKTLSAVFLGAMLGVAAGLPADAENLAPSPAWARAMPPGPDARVKVTEPYARMVARDAYFWAWPMINIYNKRLGFGKASKPGLLDGVLPVAPVNRLAMLRDYIDPAERGCLPESLIQEPTSRTAKITTTIRIAISAAVYLVSVAPSSSFLSWLRTVTA
jgi:hypothetical protein